MHVSLPACLRPPVDSISWAPPIDVVDTAVRLETAGITDTVAQRDYEQPNVMALAEVCFASLEVAANRKPSTTPPFSKLREYLHGISFALPLVLCCLAMVIFHASLWGGDVSTNMAAAVGLGTVSSFIVTGGIVQATARRGLFLIGVAEHRAAAEFCLKFVRFGVLALAISGVAMVLMARYFTWLQAPFDLAALAFHLCLGLLWLATGILHMVERNIWSAMAVAVGTFIVLVLYRVFGVHLAVAQITGILAAAAVASWASLVFLRAPARKQQSKSYRKASLAFELYVTWPHVVFGASYFLLVFSDRLLAWSVPDFAASSALQFRGDYETALDIALFGFVIQIGNVRTSYVQFFYKLAEAQKGRPLQKRSAFMQDMNDSYRSLSVRCVLLALISSVFVYGAAGHVIPVESERIAPALLWALVGFSALAFALWNTSLLLRLSLTSDVLQAIVPALLLDVAAGYILTRMGGYHYAAAGFAAGATCYAVLSTRSVARRLSAIDYYYYASAT